MQLFLSGKLNPHAFDEPIRRGTNDLGDVLLAAVQSHSSSVEVTHFLSALAGVRGGVTAECLSTHELTAEHWRSGLATCAETARAGPPPAHLLEGTLHPAAHEMLKDAAACTAERRLGRITEPVLLLAALRHLPPAALQLFEATSIDREQWCRKLKQIIDPPPPVAAFSPDGTVRMESFSPRGKKVLRLLRAEAEALGYSIADPRHLLLAMLAVEGGVTQYGIYHQGLQPRKVQEALMLQLRARAKGARSVVPLDRPHLQRLLQQLLTLAGELAARSGGAAITEAHLLQAFVATDSTARTLLDDEGVKLGPIGETAQRYEAAAEEDEEESAIADIETVRKRLAARLVGQDAAIEQILPYVELMRFGFTTPERPVGVFLFCGQSGSGKTEMAKELARGVYGSEDNLIFLEMGQFNSPESMNIFVGAPPGYIGFGQGKLTNGLRDKPRSVVLFDELEKADPKVLDALLRFLDEGKIDDPAGPVRDGSQCLIILTSNVGQDTLTRLGSQRERGPAWRSEVRGVLREEFLKPERKLRPEFLNRVDEILLFKTLSEADYTTIAERQLGEMVRQLQKERQIEVTPDRSVAQSIGAYCAAISEGARAVRRLLRAVVLLPVSRFVLEKKRLPPVRVRVRALSPGGDAKVEPQGLVEWA
jgi:ATP-dependent Clp protease ATP-binding subunit ClpA